MFKVNRYIMRVTCEGHFEQLQCRKLKEQLRGHNYSHVFLHLLHCVRFNKLLFISSDI